MTFFRFHNCRNAKFREKPWLVPGTVAATASMSICGDQDWHQEPLTVTRTQVCPQEACQSVGSMPVCRNNDCQEKAELLPRIYVKSAITTTVFRNHDSLQGPCLSAGTMTISKSWTVNQDPSKYVCRNHDWIWNVTVCRIRACLQ